MRKGSLISFVLTWRRWELNAKENIAWCAGIIDGEGTIRIDKVPASQLGKSRCCSPRYALRVSVAMTCRETILAVQRTIGGSISVSNPKNPNHNKCWTLVVASQAAEKAVKTLRPYLITKQRQAQVGLEFRRRFHVGVKPGRALSPEVLEIREASYLEMLELNARGAQKK